MISDVRPRRSDGRRRRDRPSVGNSERAAEDRWCQRPREVDVLRLMAAGMTTKDIAEQLDLTVNTVRSYTQALMEKLGAHTRVQAIVYAQKLQLI
jgi:DNA-binding NarL/FixJ family response regulator